MFNFQYQFLDEVCDDHCILVLTLSCSLVSGLLLIAAALWGKKQIILKHFGVKIKHESEDKYLSEMEDYK